MDVDLVMAGIGRPAGMAARRSDQLTVADRLATRRADATRFRVDAERPFAIDLDVSSI